jgi:cell division protein FtsW (lipid II flippase)
VGYRWTYEMSAWRVDHGRRRLGMPLAEMRARSRVFVSLMVLNLQDLKQILISLSRLDSGRWTGMGFLSSESHRGYVGKDFAEGMI